MKIRPSLAVSLALLAVVVIAGFVVYGTHAFTIVGRIGEMIF